MGYYMVPKFVVWAQLALALAGFVWSVVIWRQRRSARLTFEAKWPAIESRFAAHNARVELVYATSPADFEREMFRKLKDIEALREASSKLESFQALQKLRGAYGESCCCCGEPADGFIAHLPTEQARRLHGLSAYGYRQQCIDWGGIEAFLVRVDLRVKQK